MRLIAAVAFLLLALLACESKKEEFQPIAKTTKNYFLNHVPDIRKVDTLYLAVDSVTRSMKYMIQSVEYYSAWKEAVAAGNPDSLKFQATSDSLIYAADEVDNVAENQIFFFYRARAAVIYTTKSNERKTAHKWLYFNRSFNLVPKYAFVQKVASKDNEPMLFDDYPPKKGELIESYFNGVGVIKY